MNMATLKTIKPLEDYPRLSDGDFGMRVDAVVTGMTGNANFPNPPVDPAALKAVHDDLKALVVEALDGSKKAIAQKKKQRVAVTKMMRLNGRYVEVTCNDDMAIFKASGFVAAPTTKAASVSLSERIRKVEHKPN